MNNNMNPVTSIPHEGLVERMRELLTVAARELFGSIDHPEDGDGSAFELYLYSCCIPGTDEWYAEYLEGTPIARAVLEDGDVVGVAKMALPHRYLTQDAIDDECRRIFDEYIDEHKRQMDKGGTITGDEPDPDVEWCDIVKRVIEWWNEGARHRLHSLLGAWTSMRVYVDYAKQVIDGIDASGDGCETDYGDHLPFWRGFGAWRRDEFGEGTDDSELHGLWRNLHRMAPCCDCPSIEVTRDRFVKYVMSGGEPLADLHESAGTTLSDLLDIEGDGFALYLSDSMSAAESGAGGGACRG